MQIGAVGRLVEQNILGSAEGKLRVSVGMFQNSMGTPMVEGYMGSVLHLVLHPYLVQHSRCFACMPLVDDSDCNGFKENLQELRRWWTRVQSPVPR